MNLWFVGAVVWGEGWRGKYISGDNVVTCPRCKIYQSRHQGYVTLASYWSVSSKTGLWLADAVPRGKLSVAEPPSQDNHTPSHPNGHKNPANGEMSPWPDQTSDSPAEVAIQWLVSQPRHSRKSENDVKTPETTQKQVWASPGVLPGDHNHLICLSDKNMKLLSIPYKRRWNKESCDVPLKLWWQKAANGAIYQYCESRALVSGLWVASDKYDIILMASPLFMALHLL